MKTSAVLKTSTPPHPPAHTYAHIFLLPPQTFSRPLSPILPSPFPFPCRRAEAWVSLGGHVFSARHASKRDRASVISHCCQNIIVWLTFSIVPVLLRYPLHLFVFLLPPPPAPHLTLQQTMAPLAGAKWHGGENNSQREKRGRETEII